MTLYNERASVDRFFRELAEFTRLPDELVIVDGGSNDGTVDSIKSHIPDCPVPVSLIEERRCNVPRGRNIAIKNAQYDVIAITDMGCVIAKDWLELIVAPFETDDGIDVVGGYYEPIRQTPIQDCYFHLTFKPSLDRNHFLPSSRSLAIRRHVWEAVGGYPEHIIAGEDTLFDLDIRRKGFKEIFVPNAKVYWEVKDSYYAFFRQYYRYARGAGRALILPQIYAFYVINYMLFLVWPVLALAWRPLFWLVLGGHIFAYSWYRIFRKKAVREHLSAANMIDYFGITIAIDLASIVGYAVGIGKWIFRIDERWGPAWDKR